VNDGQKPPQQFSARAIHPSSYISGMANPAKVVGYLDLAGQWLRSWQSNA
jgi:hypothetical protein